MKSVSQNKKEFSHLIQKYQGIIHKITFVYSDTKYDREELFQEICLQLWKSYSSFKNKSQFSTWLYRVALNTAINYIRKKKKSIQYDSFKEVHQIPYDQGQGSVNVNLLYDAISKLNRFDRALIILWLEEKNYDEIAQITGISKSNVSVKLVRIKRKLNEMVNGQ